MEATTVEACVSYMLCETSFVKMFDTVANELGFTDVRYVATCWAECMSLLEKSNATTCICSSTSDICHRRYAWQRATESWI